jgi:hypothetical protein
MWCSPPANEIYSLPHSRRWENVGWRWENVGWGLPHHLSRNMVTVGKLHPTKSTAKMAGVRLSMMEGLRHRLSFRQTMPLS